MINLKPVQADIATSDISEGVCTGQSVLARRGLFIAVAVLRIAELPHHYWAAQAQSGEEILQWTVLLPINALF